jgi:phosphatidylglycerophosphate synthase
MLTLSNGISFLRAPLALLFLTSNFKLRLFAIFAAMFSDIVDGYLARRNHSTSRFGAILDPAMDKFFVLFVLIVFHHEGQILTWQLLAMLGRDFALFFYLLYLLITSKLKTVHYRSLNWGKITTALQFSILIALTISLPIPTAFFFIFILLGVFAFFELIGRHFPKKN